mgnify:FL=1
MERNIRGENMGIDIETLAAARKYAKKAAKEEGVNQNFYDDFVTI